MFRSQGTSQKSGELAMSVAINVLEFSQLHDGKPITLYAGVISAADLVERYVIPVWDSEKETGYQRPAYESRVRKIASYVITNQGLMPTSILVNVRSGSQYEAQNGHGVLTIPDGRTLTIIDGQHRAKGLEVAKERKQPLPYAVPVVFALGLNAYDEMRLFEVVNSTQKSVPTDLVAELLRIQTKTTADRGGHVTDVQLRQEASVNIVRSLAERPGPWFGKIQMADEVKTDKPIRLATLARTLEAFLSGDWASNRVKTRDHKMLTKAVASYWNGLEKLMPAAFSDAKSYSVQGPTGAWVFGWVLKDMARLADKANDWSPEFFERQLQDLDQWVDSETWNRRTGDDLTRAKGRGIARILFEHVYRCYSQKLTGGLEQAA
jgi:DGQHR domain-containing protein